jgi:hypothetical protein
MIKSGGAGITGLGGSEDGGRGVRDGEGLLVDAHHLLSIEQVEEDHLHHLGAHPPFFLFCLLLLFPSPFPRRYISFAFYASTFIIFSSLFGQDIKE